MPYPTKNLFPSINRKQHNNDGNGNDHGSYRDSHQPSSTSYETELKIACLAVQKAVIITKKVLSESNYKQVHNKNDDHDGVGRLPHTYTTKKEEHTSSPPPSVQKISKEDSTSVTIADFASQALIISAIHHHFPNDVIVAEEDTSVLYGKRGQVERHQGQQDAGNNSSSNNNDNNGVENVLRDASSATKEESRNDDDLINQIWTLVSSSDICLDDKECNESIPAPRSKTEMLNLIDLGGKSLSNLDPSSSSNLSTSNEKDGYEKNRRTWFIDPIDGTKAFLENGQYAVCVSLLVDGEEKVAALGCPHLDVDIGLFCADKNDGCSDDYKDGGSSSGSEREVEVAKNRLGEEGEGDNTSIQKNSIQISEDTANTKGSGYLVTAVKHQGAYIRPLSTGRLLPARRIPNIKYAPPAPVYNTSPDPQIVSPPPPPPLPTATCIRVAENCNSTKPAFPNRHKIVETNFTNANSDSDWRWQSIHIYSSQLRYIALSLQACDAVIRTPWGKEDSAPAHIWDHAGGVMIFEEVGGRVTDLNGKKLVFTAGRDLVHNFGLVAAPKGIHQRLLQGAKNVMAEY